MKKPTKRVLALALVALMACPMTAAWANTATITKVVVRDTTGANVLWTYEGDEIETATIKADASNLVDVTVQITDDSDAAAPVCGVASTFLSHWDGAEELSNENIQFVDQTTTDETTGTATYTFRPRASLVEGNYLAKSGGEGVTAAASKQYTVATADVQWTLAATNNNVESGSTAALVYNFTLPASASMPVALTAVTINDADAAYEYDAEAKTLSLTGYPNTDAGTYTVKVSASGYAAATATYVVTEPVVDVPIEEGDEEIVESGINSALGTNANPEVTGSETDGYTGKVELSGDQIIGTGTYDIVYSLVNASTAVTLDGNVVTYDYSKMGDGVIAETVTVKASVGQKQQTKDFYFVKPGTALGFGNAAALTNDGGKVDVFASQDAIATIEENDALKLRAQILNIVYNQQMKDSAAQWEETLDYDRNGKVTLAEYYIIKRMLDERAAETVHNVYNVDNVAGSRPEKQ